MSQAVAGSKRIRRILLIVSATAAAMSWSIENIVSDDLRQLRSSAVEVLQMEQAAQSAAWPSIASDIFQASYEDQMFNLNFVKTGIGDCNALDVFVMVTEISSENALSRNIDLYRPWLGYVHGYYDGLKRLRSKVIELDNPDISQSLEDLKSKGNAVNDDMELYRAAHQAAPLQLPFAGLIALGPWCNVHRPTEQERAAFWNRNAAMGSSNLVPHVYATRTSLFALAKQVDAVLAAKEASLDRWLRMLHWLTLAMTAIAGACAFWREMSE